MEGSYTGSALASREAALNVTALNITTSSIATTTANVAGLIPGFCLAVAWAVSCGIGYPRCAGWFRAAPGTVHAVLTTQVPVRGAAVRAGLRYSREGGHTCARFAGNRKGAVAGIARRPVVFSRIPHAGRRRTHTCLTGT